MPSIPMLLSIFHRALCWIKAGLARPRFTSHPLPTPARTVEGWLDLLRRRPATGGAVFDLQLAAAMLANGVQRIYTFNTDDFKPIKEIECLTP